jgi:hypothetical protein
MGSGEREEIRRVRRPSFEVTIGLVVLCLSLLYALAFSRMVFDSLMEQHIAPHVHRLRFEGQLHYHHPAEWVLLVVPAATGWIGTFGSVAYLTRRRGKDEG